jgi:hypothetical protein
MELNDHLNLEHGIRARVWILATGSRWRHPIDARLTFMERHKFLV